MKVDILIKNEIIYTKDENNIVIDNGIIAIKDGNILAIDYNNQKLSLYKASKVIDATGNVVLPGFVNTHIHIFSLS